MLKGPTIVLRDFNKFNCPDIDWKASSVPSNRIRLQLYDFAETNGLVQCVDRPTRSNNLVH